MRDTPSPRQTAEMLVLPHRIVWIARIGAHSSLQELSLLAMMCGKHGGSEEGGQGARGVVDSWCRIGCASGIDVEVIRVEMWASNDFMGDADLQVDTQSLGLVLFIGIGEVGVWECG